MFIVFGINGPTFRGPLENLARVPGVPSARRSRAPETEGEELGPEYRFDLDAAGAGQVSTGSIEQSPYARAAAAYARQLPRAIDRGPVHHAYQVMGRNVFTLAAGTPVRLAWHALIKHGVHQAPVLDPSQAVIGWVSRRDLLTVIDVEGDRLSGWQERTVDEVMSTPVVCAEPVTDIRRIARVLIDTGLSALPVLSESGGLLGIVSRGDILRAAVADPPLSLWA